MAMFDKAVEQSRALHGRATAPITQAQQDQRNRRRGNYRQQGQLNQVANPNQRNVGGGFDAYDRSKALMGQRPQAEYSQDPNYLPDDIAAQAQNAALQGVYQNQLNRPGDAEGMAFYQGKLDSGEMTFAQVQAAIQASAEGEAYTNPNEQWIDEEYQSQFGRDSDVEGRNFYSDLRRQGYSEWEVSQMINEGARGGDMSAALTGTGTGGATGDFTPEQLAQHWADNPGSMQDAMNANPGAWGITPDYTPPVDYVPEPSEIPDQPGSPSMPGTEELYPADELPPQYAFTSGFSDQDTQQWAVGERYLEEEKANVRAINQTILDTLPQMEAELVGLHGDAKDAKYDEFMNQIFAGEADMTKRQALIESALTESRDAATTELLMGMKDANDRLIEGETSALDTLEAGTEAGVGALDPFASGGGAAFDRAGALAGGEGAAEAYADYAETPGQQYLREQGERAILQNAAATGSVEGGNVQLELLRHGQGLAAQNVDQRIAQQTELAKIGVGAAGGQADLYGQQGQTGAGINTQAAQQQAQNNFATAAQISQNAIDSGKSISQQRANVADTFMENFKMRAVGGREMLAEEEAAISNVMSTLNATQLATLQNIMTSEQARSESARNFLISLVSAQKGGSPGGGSGAVYAAGAAVFGSILDNWNPSEPGP